VAGLGRSACALAALLFAVLLLAPAGRAQENLRLVEQDIKAGLLYNFLRYTEWPHPPAPGDAVVVCVWGDDPFEGRLAPMAGRTVNQRRIEIRAVHAENQLNGCALLFINAGERANWPTLRQHLQGRSILTVSDYDGFAQAGGMLEFARVSNRIAVRINVAAAQSADLQVEDRLLRLASVVGARAP
jgi:hypothetical protein